MRNAVLAATILSGLAAVIGVWFWQHENSYAASHPGSSLSSTLQWAGAGIALLGVAGVLFGVALLRREE